MAAIIYNGMELELVSEDLKRYRLIMMAAVNQGGLVLKRELKFSSEDLWRDS